jgi:hypothetical protein
MKKSPLASFRPDFDLPWRGAPPIVKEKPRKMKAESKKKPWSPASKNLKSTRKTVTFSNLPPRPKSSSLGLRRNKKSIRQRPKSGDWQGRNNSRLKSRSKSRSKSTSRKSRSPTNMGLRQLYKSNMIIDNKIIAPYWHVASNTNKAVALHPNEYQASKYESLEKILANEPKRRNKNLSHEMIDAAMRGELTKVRMAIEVDGRDPDYVDQDFWGDTALIRACEHGQLHIVRYLILNANANIDEKSNDGNTAIQIAMKFKRQHITAFLDGYKSWQRKAESSTYLTRRAAMDITSPTKQLKLSL